MRSALAVFSLCFVGCIDLAVEPRPDAGNPLDDCPGCAEVNDITGEAFLFVNGKLTDPAASYTVNLPDENGGFIGAALFLYDPSRKGHLVKVGNVGFGPDPEVLDGHAYTQFRDLAWSPTHGLWAITIETVNDEWKLTKLSGALDETDTRFSQQSWALRVDCPNCEPPVVGDPAYTEEDLSGMTFVDDVLHLAARGLPGANSPGGSIYSAVLPSAYGIEPMYPNDPDFYADRVLTERKGRFPSHLGVAGDIFPSGDGELISVVRSEQSAAGALNRNFVWRTQLDGFSSAPTEASIQVVRNDDLQGLARVGGVLYAIDTRARIYAIDVAAGAVTLHDDLSPLFVDPENGLRIRGATTVVLP